MPLKYYQKELVTILKLRPTGQKGWFGGTCPFCGRPDKFGIVFDSLYKGKIVTSFNCFHSNCGKRGGLYTLLKHLGRLDLFQFKDRAPIYQDKVLKKFSELNKLDEINLDLEEVSLPVGFKRIEYDEYLENRNFLSSQYDRYEVGITTIVKLLNNYLIFPIKENGKILGYVARLKKSKKEIDSYNEKAVLLNKPLLRRYRNTKGVDFSKLLMGYDEIGVNTTTVILVEGPFDKFNVDKLLDLDNQEEIKCNATFGSKISDEQIIKLKLKKVSNIILLYDAEAIKSTKKAAQSLASSFNTNIGVITEENKDPGELTGDELFMVLENLISFSEYFLTKLELISYGSNR